MRVRDVLEMLAEGATEVDILRDFPYLVQEDIRAALAFAVTQSDHAIVLAAE
jgi:uncharacterized protein (DUF433 family)